MQPRVPRIVLAVLLLSVVLFAWTVVYLQPAPTGGTFVAASWPSAAVNVRHLHPVDDDF